MKRRRRSQAELDAEMIGNLLAENLRLVEELTVGRRLVVALVFRDRPMCLTGDQHQFLTDALIAEEGRTP